MTPANLDPSGFQHQAVRDLAWACFSAPLMAQLPGSDAQLWSAGPDTRDWRWLTNLDQHPEPLLAALAAKPGTRLGLYFERLWQFYLQQHPRWTMLAHNLPVMQAGRTLGAFDFLCQHGPEFWHLELTVKFYLGVSEASEPSSWQHWRGPNSTDRLDIKLERLRSHQLALSQSPHSQMLLRDLAQGEVPWQRGLIIKGYYFYPGGAQHNPPADAHPQHLRGTWWHLSQFLSDVLPQLEGAHWHSLAKMEWLSPALLNQADALLSGPALKALLLETVGAAQRPLLLANMRPWEQRGGHQGQQQEQQWREQERVFVVPDHWPGTARP